MIFFRFEEIFRRCAKVPGEAFSKPAARTFFHLLELVSDILQMSGEKPFAGSWPAQLKVTVIDPEDCATSRVLAGINMELREISRSMPGKLCACW